MDQRRICWMVFNVCEYEMTISREKCLEIGNAVYGHTHWNEAMLRRLEELCNRAYQEGARDMRERAVECIKNSSDQLMADFHAERIKELEIKR